MRLIDADKLLQDIEHYHLSDGKFQHWVEVQPVVTINDSAEENKVTNCNHNADVGKKVASSWGHENGKDVIYRQDAINALDCLNGAEEVLKRLPSAQPKPKPGEWLLHTYMPHNKYCSCCKKDSPYNKRWDYCPNCGCRMLKESDEHD